MASFCHSRNIFFVFLLIILFYPSLHWRGWSSKHIYVNRLFIDTYARRTKFNAAEDQHPLLRRRTIAPSASLSLRALPFAPQADFLSLRSASGGLLWHPRPPEPPVGCRPSATLPAWRKLALREYGAPPPLRGECAGEAAHGTGAISDVRNALCLERQTGDSAGTHP